MNCCRKDPLASLVLVETMRTSCCCSIIIFKLHFFLKNEVYKCIKYCLVLFSHLGMLRSRFQVPVTCLCCVVIICAVVKGSLNTVGETAVNRWKNQFKNLRPQLSTKMVLPSKGFQDLIFQNGIMGNCSKSCGQSKTTKYQQELVSVCMPCTTWNSILNFAEWESDPII